ncbi:hypothetical protein Y032_0089g2328 [Ancylostoma ceylanicum]|nr:hypothetical protein Y032_0089g2328 [Ancylostoma ceylanicum]
MNDAVSTLERLDHERPIAEEELKKRRLEFQQYTESDVESQRSSEYSTFHRASGTTAIPTVNMTSYVAAPQPATTANMSFVDASILSKLDLPLFEGNLLEFPEYWARFSTLVGDKPQLDGTTKFSLLKSTLRGRALQTIKGLSITAANYPIAVEILKNHFDDRVTTRHILYTRLASLPPCDKEDRNLFALYSQMFALVRQFTTYEDDSKEYALGAILLNKLPRRIRSRIHDEDKNQENLVPTELLRILTKIVRGNLRRNGGPTWQRQRTTRELSLPTNFNTTFSPKTTRLQLPHQ